MGMPSLRCLRSGEQMTLYQEALAEITELKRDKAELERDCIILASRLYLEDDNSFAPETLRVMRRMRPKVAELLKETA